MANIKLREQARNNREQLGESIKEISDKLKVPKSTVSYWCRDIVLSEKHLTRLIVKQREESKKGSLLYAEKLRKSRIDREYNFKKEGRNQVGDITKRDLQMLGIALYWAEGYKNGNTEVGFTNSDPAMIALILEWFIKIYGVSKKDFIFRLSINHSHEKREKKVIEFWTKYLNIDKSQFTKTSFIKSVSKKVYSNHENYFGVLRVKVRRAVNLRSKILGAIEFLSKK